MTGRKKSGLKSRNRALFFLSILLPVFTCDSTNCFAQETPPFSVQIFPSVVPNGGVLFGTASAGTVINASNPPQVLFFEKAIDTFPASEDPKKPNVFHFFVGIPYEATAGKHELQIQWNGKTIKVPFEITLGKYEEEKLSVDPSKVSPPKKSIKRILQEKEEVGKIYKHSELSKLWIGPMQLPIESPITSQYGNKRTFNGKLASFHSGMDLKAKVGTPVRPSARGRVVLAKDLYFTGGTVIIDHGYRFYSIYAHLSKIKCKVGDMVDYSNIIALSGDTGRVSGPHLHWGIIFNGVKVDPAQALRVVGTQNL